MLSSSSFLCPVALKRKLVESEAWLDRQAQELQELRRISRSWILKQASAMAEFEAGNFYGPPEHATANVPLLLSYGENQFFLYDDKNGGGVHVGALTPRSENDGQVVTYAGVTYRASIVARPCTGIPIWRTARALNHETPMECSTIELINLLRRIRPDNIDVEPLPEEFVDARR